MSADVEIGSDRISVFDAVSAAIDRTARILFRPFRIEVWFTLGFCAWLAMLGQQGGGSGSSSWRDGPERTDVREGMHQASEWLLENLVPVILIGGLILFVIAAVILIVTWLSSRGKFMFLDGVVRNRGAVVEPWGLFRSHGNALFVFRILLALVGLTCFVVVALVFGGLAWSVAGDGGDSALVLPLVLLLLLVVVPLILAFVMIGFLIEDFVVPLMYLRGAAVGPAWTELRALFASQPGAFVLYTLARFLISIVLAVMILTICLFSCCIVLIPYIGTVILLPIWVFRRSLPLAFLAQFGPDYARFGPLEPAPTPSVTP